MNTALFLPDNSLRICEGDCRDVLPALSSDTMDLIITSPPYAEARKRLGRNFIGIEKVSEYAETARNRINKVHRFLSAD